MRHYHKHEEAYIEATTGQSWLAAEMVECSHLYRDPLPYLERIRQDGYIRQLAGALLDTETSHGYNVQLIEHSIAIFKELQNV